MEESAKAATIVSRESSWILIRRGGLAILMAAAWVIGCLVAEHYAGIYQPSETTGRGSNAAGFLGTIVVIGWIVAFPPRGVSTTFVKRFLRGLSVAFSTALVLGVAKYLYFFLVWGDFSGKMAEFTRTTLQARGANPKYVASFTDLVQASWRTSHVAANSFLVLFVWGAVFALIASAVSTGIARWRMKSR